MCNSTKLRKLNSFVYTKNTSQLTEKLYLVRMQTARYTVLVYCTAIVALASFARVLNHRRHPVIATAIRSDFVPRANEPFKHSHKVAVKPHSKPTSVIHNQHLPLHGIPAGDVHVVGGVVLLQSPPDEGLCPPHRHHIVAVQVIALREKTVVKERVFVPVRGLLTFPTKLTMQ